MNPGPMRRASLLCAAAMAGALGCGGDGGESSDASMVGGDAGPRDAAVSPDAIHPLMWVDFAVSGCAEDTRPGPGDVDGGVPEAPCTGPAPLRLAFTAIAPAPIEVTVWQFGDGAEDTRLAPTHVYELPGTYTVSLSAQGPGGTASASKPDKVIVTAAPLGSLCTASAQCESGQCVCGDGAPCPAGFETGLCTAPCGPADPCSSGLCADLSPPGATGGEDWQKRLCLPGCAGACPPGLACRELRSGSDDAWIEACFPPGLLGDIGDSCADEAGVLDDARCTSGTCLAEGARGLCTAECAAVPCPASAACATFNGGGGPACLRRCESAGDCTGDPWLACQAPGGAGAKGFTVAEPAAPLGYCAPKRCSQDLDCGPDGTCSGGFCGP